MDTTETSKTPPPWLLRSTDLLALVFALILLGFHVSWLEKPWGNSHCGVNSGAYYGYACKGLEAFGYTESRMQGPLLFHPSGKGLFLPYTNHPGTIYSIIYPCYRFLGRDERALRLPMLFMLALNLAIIRFGLSPLIGRFSASAATIGFASLPMFFQFGTMVDLPLFCLSFFIPVVVTWLRYRKLNTRGALWAFASIAFVAGLFDWYCYFLLPVLALEVLFSRGSFKEKIRLWLQAALPFGLAFLLVFSWLLWAEGSFDRLTTTVEGLLLAIGVSGPKSESQHFLTQVSWGYWWQSLRTNASHTFTLPFLGVSGFGLLTAIVAPRVRALALRPGLMLLVAGLLPCVAFRTHASKHEFWPMVGCAGLVFFFGLGVRRLWDLFNRMKLPGAALTLLLLTMLASLGAVHGVEFRELSRGSHDQKRTAIKMNEDFDESDLVFTSDSLSPSRFYRNFVTVPQATNLRFMRLALAKIRPHRGQFKRAFMLWNKNTAADWQWLQEVPALGEIEDVEYLHAQYFRRQLDIDRLWDF